MVGFGFGEVGEQSSRSQVVLRVLERVRDAAELLGTLYPYRQ